MVRIKADCGNILSNIHDYNINPETREIFLHGFIGGASDENYGIDYRQAATFQKNMTYLNHVSKEDIIIHMCTSGGDWGFGMAIYDIIVASPSRTTIIAYGYAESMSGIILQAASNRIIAANTEIMLHYGTISVDSDHKSVESTVAWNNILAQQMLFIFVNRAKDSSFFKNYTYTQIKNFFKKKLEQKGDWFLTPVEAIQYGLADRILGTDIETIKKGTKK